MREPRRRVPCDLQIDDGRPLYHDTECAAGVCGAKNKCVLVGIGGACVVSADCVERGDGGSLVHCASDGTCEVLVIDSGTGDTGAAGG